MSPEPLDEVTHRTSRGGNCELWGYKAIEGSDERTHKMNPPPPTQDWHPRIQKMAGLVKTGGGIPSLGSVAAQAPPQQTTLLLADPSPSLRSPLLASSSCSAGLNCSRAVLWHRSASGTNSHGSHVMRYVVAHLAQRNLTTLTFLSLVGKSGQSLPSPASRAALTFTGFQSRSIAFLLREPLSNIPERGISLLPSNSDQCLCFNGPNQS